MGRLPRRRLGAAFNERLGVVGDGVVHAYELDAATMTGRSHLGHNVALQPFLGVMGMPPDEPGEHSTIPPRACGGNLDCRELVSGSTLYLPIAVDGALFSCGDGHAAQGDGEVSGTAIECPMERAELTFGLAELAADDADRPHARGLDHPRPRTRPRRRRIIAPWTRCSNCSDAGTASRGATRSPARASTSICA